LAEKEDDMLTRVINSKAPMWLVVAAVATLMAACSPEIDRRGYIPKAGAFAQISEGMSKTEVEGILGSPSTTASVNLQGDSYYYVSSITQGRSFLKPIETDRQVIAIRFNKEDQVTSTAQYGQQDGRIIDLSTRKSIVVGSDSTIIAKLLKYMPVMKLGGGEEQKKN
jgi:outer membrane protein assembly factor BamE (lipoprotein component of BamABCDE complex)